MLRVCDVRRMLRVCDVRRMLRVCDRQNKETSLVRNISDPWLCDQYVVVAEYEAPEQSVTNRGRGHEVSLRPGEVVDVLEKNDKGAQSCVIIMGRLCMFMCNLRLHCV